MMSLTRSIVRFAAPLPRIEQYSRFLFVGPHPDDIEIGAGATASKLAAAGKEICFLICADGRYGTDNLPPAMAGDALAETREEEAIRSAALLGVQDVRFLRLRDGGFYEQRELEEGLARTISDFRPELVFAPDPCVASECHADHLNVGFAARKLACFAPNAGIMAEYGAESAPVQAIAFYMTARPNRYVAVGAVDLRRQEESVFACHQSQFPRGCAAAKSIRLYLRLRAADFGLRSLRGRAEGFRVLGQTQMHCLPEAGL